MLAKLSKNSTDFTERKIQLQHKLNVDNVIVTV